MSHLGKLSEFDPRTQNFDSYLERFELFVIANDVKPEKVLPVFLTTIGAEAYEVLKSLVVPDAPANKTFAEVKKLLQGHYSPSSSVIAERCKFNRRVQHEQESVEDFIVELKHLARKCDFGEFLNDALRDRLVAGVRNEDTQRALFAEENLKFDNACKIALGRELAARDTASMKAPDGNIHSLKSRQREKREGCDTTSQPSQSRPNIQCERCGKNHSASKCWYKEFRCRRCDKLGHLQKMCRNEPRRSKRTNAVECSEEESEQEVYHFVNMTHSSYEVSVVVEGRPLQMQIDTGAAVTIVPESVYKTTFPHVRCTPSQVSLRTYTGEQLQLKGQCEVAVHHNSQRVTLPVVVVKDEGRRLPVLLGRNWLERLKLDWRGIGKISCEDRVQAMRKKFPSVFSNELGEIRGFEAKVLLQTGCTPVFCRARPVPFAIREPTEKQLRSMVEKGTIKQVPRSDWATPIVNIQKNDGSYRICGDYKITINPVLKTDHYPLPRPEDLYSSIANGKVFCVLDLSSAYQQVPLSPESRPLLTINTSLGLFEFQRLPYGVASAPAIFQALMDRVLHGIPNVGCYIDDVIVSGSDSADCQKTLERVLERFRDYNITLNEGKCRFFQDSVTYLGHNVNSEGIYPTDTKKKAILQAPEPTTKTELKAYLGMLNFYAKFLNNVSTVAEPLYRLLKKHEKWSWTKECREAFAATKRLLTSSRVLTFYDVGKPIGLLCDASAYGLGAVIFHETAEGERPIAYASRTLTQAEKNYAQCEREALALIFGLKKFHRYLYGRSFTLYTDHQPLLGILGQDEAVPSIAAARMQRWAMTLAAYKYVLKYRRGKNVEVADALSRLPRVDDSTEEPSECLAVFECLPLTAEAIAKASKRNLTLSRVAEFTLNGWPSECADDLKPYYVRRLELSLEQGCVTWGSRVIIPDALRDRVLDLLHEEHPGASRMKMLARSFVWWPGMDQAIEKYVQQCKICQAVQPSVQPVPLHPWSYPAKCWSRVHVDFAAKDANVFLVLVDAYSKWLEVWPMTSTTASKTIEKIRGAFAAYGLPETLVSDNGPQFTSAEFADFLAANGVKHVRIPPYHAASNGAAERMVQTIKRALLKQVLEENALDSRSSFQERVDKFLCAYRNTPSSVTGHSPAQLFLKRQPRTKLSLLKPDFGHAMRDKQEHVKEECDKGRGEERVFRVGDRVYVKTVRGEHVSWQEAVVTQVVSAVTYVVKVHNQFRFVHADHLRSQHADTARACDMERPEIRIRPPEQPPSATPVPLSPDHSTAASSPPIPRTLEREPSGPTAVEVTTAPEAPAHLDVTSPPTVVASSPESADTTAPRRSTRVRKLPDRFRHEDFRK